MTNGRGANDDCVADHAMGMLIAVVRNFRKLDQQCRAGVWRTQIPVPPGISGKRLGILGMGAIGERSPRALRVSACASAITTAIPSPARRTRISTA